MHAAILNAPPSNERINKQPNNFIAKHCNYVLIMTNHLKVLKPKGKKKLLKSSKIFTELMYGRFNLQFRCLKKYLRSTETER